MKYIVGYKKQTIGLPYLYGFLSDRVLNTLYKSSHHVRSILFLLFLCFGVAFGQLTAQECTLTNGDFSKLQSSDLDPDTKTSIGDALRAFVVNYNKYADGYDEEYEVNAESDFLDMLDTKSAKAIYLNDVRETPEKVEAIKYLQDLSKYFPQGYKFCLYSVNINEIKQLQDLVYTVSVTAKKTMDVLIRIDDVLFKNRELEISFDLILDGGIEPGVFIATMSSSKLLSITDLETGVMVAFDGRKQQKKDKDIAMSEPKQTKIKEPKRKEETTYSVKDDRKFKSGFSNRRYLMLSGMYGYGLPKYGALDNNSYKEDGIKFDNYNIGFAAEYWKSIAKFNKLFLSVGFQYNFTKVTNVFNAGSIINLEDSKLANRATKTQTLTFINGDNKLTHLASTIYIPIGLVYNFGSGKDGRIFKIQASVLPGFTLTSTRTLTGNIDYKGQYGPEDVCLINLPKTVDLTAEGGFTLSARLSPMYVNEIRTFKGGQSGWGFFAGLDLNIGLMPLLKTNTDKGVIQSAQSFTSTSGANSSLTFNKDQSILHSSITYHSVGLRIGLFYVMD